MEPFSIFQIDFTGFASGAAPSKAVPGSRYRFIWRFDKRSSGDLRRSFLDIAWISKEILGDLWISLLDIRLDFNWITKVICIGDLLNIKGDKKEIKRRSLLDIQSDINWITKEICCGYNMDI